MLFIGGDYGNLSNWPVLLKHLANSRINGISFVVEVHNFSKSLKVEPNTRIVCASKGGVFEHRVYFGVEEPVPYLDQVLSFTRKQDSPYTFKEQFVYTVKVNMVIQYMRLSVTTSSLDMTSPPTLALVSGIWYLKRGNSNENLRAVLVEPNKNEDINAYGGLVKKFYELSFFRRIEVSNKKREAEDNACHAQVRCIFV
eukprot:GHVS01087749.1.p1 GENE.GHVS01087749.1~~GHVS01087749.1.p1  ORF type:complete len:198 (+),score=11.72 GHVS01087749.1:543-1136(+)